MKEAYTVNCIIVTLLHELRRPDVKGGLVALYNGGDMGIATVFETC